jgi:hypothetical protein
MNIFDFPIRMIPFVGLNLDNKKLTSKLINYLNKNKCCKEYPKCEHPKQQSDANVFNIKDEFIQKLKDNYFFALQKMFGNFKIIVSKSWLLYVKEDKEVPAVWHKHYDDNIEYKDHIQVSGIFYLTDTDIGTEFENEHFKLEIKPISNCWYIWDSNLLHRPKKNITKKDRIILATQTILKNENK